MRRRRLIGLVALVLAGSLLTGCWSYSTKTNKVVGGNLYYVYYYKHASFDVVDILWHRVHGNDARKTLADMLKWAKDTTFKGLLGRVAMGVADFDYFFDPDNDGDFFEAASVVHFTNRCLVMHRSPWPASDRHNWTYRDASDGHCAWGKHYV